MRCLMCPAEIELFDTFFFRRTQDGYTIRIHVQCVNKWRKKSNSNDLDQMIQEVLGNGQLDK